MAFMDIPVNWGLNKWTPSANGHPVQMDTQVRAD